MRLPRRGALATGLQAVVLDPLYSSAGRSESGNSLSFVSRAAEAGSEYELGVGNPRPFGVNVLLT